MKFGKLIDIGGVDFRLPPDPPRTERVLARALETGKTTPKIYVGATGWGNKEWIGKWYPKKAKQKEFLKHYSQQFNTIEFNTTHYRIPEPTTIERWYSLAAEGFRFCPKVPQQISHYSRLSNAEIPTTQFISVISELREKLGPVFLQLPEYHGPKDVRKVVDYVQTWPPEMPIYFEFRHPDWFGTAPEADLAFQALETCGHGTVITDVAGRRDVLHMQLTNPVLVLRFVGNHLHPTDYTRTDEWVQRIKQWIDMGLREVYLFIHQPEMEEVPEFTAYWVDQINAACGLQVPKPRRIPEVQQGTLF